MTIGDQKIAIVGGGPGGLTLARLLQISGANVKVYERDVNRHARVTGATLDLHDDSGLKALRAAGLMDAFKENYRPGADRLLIMDKNAHILLEENVNSKDEMFRPEIDRGPLRNILLDSLDSGTVVWDHSFTGLTRLNEGIELVFKNEARIWANLVIAADGANSKIRPYITPVKGFYSGLMVLEGAVFDAEIKMPVLNQLIKGGKIFVFGDDKTLIIGGKGDGSLAYYIGFKEEESWVQHAGINFDDRNQVLRWFSSNFSGWHPLWIELIEKSEIPFIPRPQFCMPLDQYWHTEPNLTMLGDAAHLMPPYAGEGVNMAMLDALELSECLTGDSFMGIQSALTEYENKMRLRAGEVAGITLEQTDILHSPRAISHMLEMMA